MKKEKKLKLKKISVKSFKTTLSQEEIEKVKGGFPSLPSLCFGCAPSDMPIWCP